MSTDQHQLMVVMQRTIRRQPLFLSLANLFRPYRVAGHKKIRLGSEGDGGYVMLDDFKDVTAALSYGTDTNADWDMAMVERGIPVWQYDHSIERAPIEHEKIAWQKKMIVPKPQDGCATISQTLENAHVSKPETAILKIDIEGAEWDVFSEASPSDLACFTQILVEFHYFDHCNEDRFLRRAHDAISKLAKQFGVFHVHANNWSPLVEVSGVWFPGTLEVSFASRARYEFQPTDELFPTEIDQPCNPFLPDVWLGSFRFG